MEGNIMKASILVYCTSLLSQGKTLHQGITEKLNETVIDPITLDDIFISVKTTYKHHDSRLLLILRTWFHLALDQTWFFTDRDDEDVQQYTRKYNFYKYFYLKLVADGGHLINTHCKETHDRDDLCCKTNAEFDTYLTSGKKWFCHFDDDVFVNVPRLLRVLQTYDHNQDWYLGKSYKTKYIQFNKTEASNDAKDPNVSPRTCEGVKGLKQRTKKTLKKKYITDSFWVSYTNALGGGYCISNRLAIKMAPYASDGRIVEFCKQIDRPDDQAIGYIIEYVLKKRLTEVIEFHTHLEALPELDPKTFPDQITFSYGMPDNVVNIPGLKAQGDGTRFLSLYEYLYKLQRKEANILMNEAAKAKPSRSRLKMKSSHFRKMLQGKY